MPGPTTEVLNEDIKEIKAEARETRGNLDTLKAEVHSVAVSQAELRAEVRDIRGSLDTLKVDLRAEISEVRGDLDILKINVHGITVSLAELRTEVRVSLGLARWAGTLMVATILGGGVSAVWWASGLTAEVKRLAESLPIQKPQAEPTPKR